MTAVLCRAATAVFDKVTELVLGDQPNAELVALFEEHIGAPVRDAVDELEPVAVAAGCSTPVTWRPRRLPEAVRSVRWRCVMNAGMSAPALDGVLRLEDLAPRQLGALDVSWPASHQVVDTQLALFGRPPRVRGVLPEEAPTVELPRLDFPGRHRYDSGRLTIWELRTQLAASPWPKAGRVAPWLKWGPLVLAALAVIVAAYLWAAMATGFIGDAPSPHGELPAVYTPAPVIGGQFR